MSMSLLFGFIVAYPINWWLVSHHLKHGMLTIRPAELASMAMPAASNPGKPKIELKASKVKAVSYAVQFRMVALTFGILALSIVSVSLLGWL
jgi:hypothetical protein